MNHYDNIAMHPSCDSQKIIHYALTTDDLHRHEPRQILMSWIMDLSQNINPAMAARTLLETYRDHPATMRGSAQTELLSLLGEVSSVATPQKRQRGHASRKRHRRC